MPPSGPVRDHGSRQHAGITRAPPPAGAAGPPPSRARIPLSRDQRKPSGSALQRWQPGPPGARFHPAPPGFRIPVPPYGLDAALYKHLKNLRCRLCRWSVYFRRGYIPIDSETRVATGPTARIKAFEVGPGVRPSIRARSARAGMRPGGQANSRSSGARQQPKQRCSPAGPSRGSPGAGRLPATSGDG